jgi:nicotinamidase-related amidase
LRPRPGNLVVRKRMAGAFSRTSLDADLRARGVDTLIVAGLMTHLAVFSTANDAMVLGYHVIVAGDATATRALPGAASTTGDREAEVVDPTVLQRAALAAMADRAADVMLARAVMALPVSR